MNSDYTLYDLSILNECLNIGDILDSLDTDEYEMLLSAVDHDGFSLDYIEWDSWEEDMINLSEKFPDIVFCLKMQDEFSTDLWIVYFQNGKSQREQGKIVYPEFNPDLLE